MFEFAHPWFLLMLILLIPAAYRIYSRRINTGLLFAPVHRIPSEGVSWRIYASVLLPAFYLIAIALAIVALARPRKTFSTVTHSTEGVAIQMVVDISGSMDALDMSTQKGGKWEYRSRLDAVKQAFADFVKRRPDDLLGLISFGGYASTLTPLTTDHEALLHVLQGLTIPINTDDPEEAMTAIGDAIATACARLDAIEMKSRIIVLLTDGASNTGIIKPSEAAVAAKKLGFKIYAIGVGRDGIAPFFSRDIFGNKVIVQREVPMDEEILKQISKDTGGRYFSVSDPAGLEEAMKDIDAMEKTKVERDVFRKHEELFLRFLIPSLLFLALAAALNIIVTGRIL